jgi:hypothetical protein
MSEGKIVNVPILVPADPSRMIEYINQLDHELDRVNNSTGRTRTVVEKDYYRQMLIVLRTIFEPVRDELNAEAVEVPTEP